MVKSNKKNNCINGEFLYIADKKIMKIYFLILFFLINIFFYGQNQNINENLDSVTISGYGKNLKITNIPKVIYVIKSKEIKEQNIESIDNILETVAGLDIRTRGSKGVQSDISVRGGNFDQVLILLNGIPVNNSQTGHNNLDLPVDISMIKKIEIIEGASGQSFGVNAYSGVINIITKNPLKTQAEAEIKFGQFGYLKTDWNIQHQMKKIAVFNGLSYKRSNGYLSKEKINNTDFISIKDFLNIKIKTKNNPIDIQLGYNQKNFGANSFYTSKYPWQFEKTNGYFAGISKKFGKKFIIEPQLIYRLNFDEFQLFRESIYKYNNGFYIHDKDTAQFAPGIYYKGHNYHKTQYLSGGIKTNFKSRFGETNINFIVQNEQIFSNVLGKIFTYKKNSIYNKKAHRLYGTLTINQVHKFGKYNLGTGLSFLYNSQYKLHITGGFYINHLNKYWTKFFSINSALRLPTFTDLYYQGPSNKGNPYLQPEKSINFETGIKFHKKQFSSGITFFYRIGKNTIDWVKKNPSDKWQPQNLTSLNTYGTELNLQKHFNNNFIKNISFSYTYLKMNKKKNIISKYALDYLKHKLSVNIIHQFFFNSNINWRFLYKNRNGQYLDYINENYKLFDYYPYFLVNLKLNKNYKKYAFAISIENLFNKEYRDLSYIKMPGRWIIFELKYYLFKK